MGLWGWFGSHWGCQRHTGTTTGIKLLQGWDLYWMILHIALPDRSQGEVALFNHWRVVVIGNLHSHHPPTSLVLPPISLLTTSHNATPCLPKSPVARFTPS